MNLRYLIGFLGIIALIILVIVLIVRAGGGSTVGPKAIDLADYITNSSEVSLTIDGPVSADQTHHSIHITVDENRATAELIKGYEGQIEDSKSYATNENSYANFILALKHAGFTVGNTGDSLKDERGYCATGVRYVYQLKDNGKEVRRFWNTSCGRDGTYKGMGELTRTLFQQQIPDYDELASPSGF
ncbi:MAG: hypothetical protein ABIR37_01060 [Candidatus Saccharimonadales bacterium]